MVEAVSQPAQQPPLAHLVDAAQQQGRQRRRLGRRAAQRAEQRIDDLDVGQCDVAVVGRRQRVVDGLADIGEALLP